MKHIVRLLLLHMIISISVYAQSRCRDLGVKPGVLPTGKYNAITDVAGVQVGHITLNRGDEVRTGVTVILPHEGNIYQQKVPAAVYVGNGFGKAAGFLQVEELGTLETPVALTNTLNVGLVVDALVEYTLQQPGNENIRSVNAVVGETNDGYLNNIRKRSVMQKHVFEAIAAATGEKVQEGNVGAGTGTVCFGWKGGIGTSSRVIPESKGGYTVGVLVQSNFGGVLTIDGRRVGEELGKYYLKDAIEQGADGSCMIVIATDAPLSPRNLKRLAKRAMLGLARTGGISSNGSGDFVIAFSTAPENRIDYQSDNPLQNLTFLRNDRLSPLFLAVIEATEEAIYNSLFMATDICGYKGHCVKALPVRELFRK